MLKPTRSAARALSLAARLRRRGGGRHSGRVAGTAAPSACSCRRRREGRLLILPGVGNTRFHLAGFVAAAEAQLPRFDVEVRPWGVPFMTIHNLRAHERNTATVAAIAAEIAQWRRANPDAPFYLVGYSGGGGMATLVTAALPDDVSIDRLVLVAPAISPDYPLASEVLPHVREYVVNYASERDLQVGWGTRTFGTIDRKYTDERRRDRLRRRARAPARVALVERRRAARPRRQSSRVSRTGVGRPRSCCRRSIRLVDPEALRARWAQTCKER